MTYKADITAGALNVPERRVVAGLPLQGLDAKGWRDAVVERNVLQARSPATASRLVKLIRGRPETMDSGLWKLVEDGKGNVATHAVLAAAVRGSPLLLQVLFLVRCVEEFKSNIDNFVTLCLDRIDADRLALKRKIEESLARLEKETLISRNGENFFFLTNEERDINKEIEQVDLTGGEEAKLLGEIVFDDVLKGQRKHRYSADKMDFTFNRLCDLHPVGNRADGALLVSVVTPLADQYDGCEKARCLLESMAEGGHVILRLAKDDGLGRELRVWLQTDKYLKRKNDGTLVQSTVRILSERGQDNQQRRERLVQLLGTMIAGAEVYAAGQPLKVKSASAEGVLEEALEYLIRNTFHRMGHPKRLSPEPLKEIQAVLRGNDLAKEQLLFEKGETNPDALEDLRNHVALAGIQSRQTVLHDSIKKRYALRPYGWPEEEVLLLLARLVVPGEVVLLLDGGQVPTDKVYEAINAPAKRRKILVQKRQTADPKALLSARNLGEKLFAEMGPDGEEGQVIYLKNKLRDWHDYLATAKPLADTGDYPGKEAIDDGFAPVKKRLGIADGFKFVEQFNLLRKDLEDLADSYQEVSHFYGHQKTARDKLRKARDRFQKNRLELERHATAGPAFKRVQEILAAPSPYGLIQEGEGLIAAAAGVHDALVAEVRQKAVSRIDGLVGTLTQDVAKVGGDAALRSACVQPLDALKAQVRQDESVAHVAQAESEAVKAFDAAVKRIENHETHEAHENKTKEIKRQKIVRPADLLSKTYLETSEEVEAFLAALRAELEAALQRRGRIPIR